MPQIDLVDVMRKSPGRCTICNTTPMEEGVPKGPNIDANVDVDWGNNLYICIECATVIAELLGFEDPSVVENLRTDLRRLSNDHQNLRKRFQKKELELRKLAEGRKVEERQKRKKAA